MNGQCEKCEVLKYCPYKSASVLQCFVQAETTQIVKKAQTEILTILHGIDTQVEQMVRDALGEQTGDN